MGVTRLANGDVRAAPHGYRVVYRQLEKVILNLLLGVLEAHLNRWCTVRYKAGASPPARAAPLFMMLLGQRSNSRVAQVPGLQSPADASNSDAGAERIRIR